MSWGYKGGIKLPGYDPLNVANAPTIGTATAGNSLCASVTFTAPSCTGGSVITTYTVFCTTTGTNTATGATSPIVVSGLTNATSYTFKVIATNIYGPSYPSAASNSITASNAGSQSYTTAGTYSWVAPAGVTSVSVVAVGGGGGAGTWLQGNATSASGGALGYKNNYAVTPGNSYTVVVGAGGAGNNAYPGNTPGGDSYFVSTAVIKGGGGPSGKNGADSCASSYTGDGGGAGGISPYNAGNPGGGGGAGGYSGAGGNGGAFQGTAGTAGAGGGGGGGFAYYPSAASTGAWGGGGVGILGQGANGAAGTCGSRTGKAGSGGSNGGVPTFNCKAGAGGAYGGGGGWGFYCTCTTIRGAGGAGGGGAVRIVWPGNTRTFPSTCVGSP